MPERPRNPKSASHTLTNEKVGVGVIITVAKLLFMGFYVAISDFSQRQCGTHGNKSNCHSTALSVLLSATQGT